MAYVNLGLLLGRQGRSDEAVEMLRKAINDFPGGQIRRADEVIGLLEQLNQVLLADALREKLPAPETNAASSEADSGDGRNGQSETSSSEP